MKTEASGYHFLQMPSSLQRGGVTSMVTDSLRRAIIGLDIPPGAVIDKAEVCTRLGVSRFPVSEALGRLRDEGLVEIQPQRGSIVSRIRIADILEYMLIRRALELEVVELAAALGDPRLVDALRLDIERQRAAGRHDDPVAFHSADLSFHQHLADALELPRLKSVIDSARASLDRARRLIRTPDRLPRAVEEHVAIVDAIERRDPAAAADAMRNHLDAITGNIVGFARSHPEQFADGGEDFTRRLTSLFPPQ